MAIHFRSALLLAALPVATAILPLTAAANLPPGKPVSQTIQMLQADPLFIHTLDISDDEKNELMLDVIRYSENPGSVQEEPLNENAGLIHKANFFEQFGQFFGGGQQQQPQYAPRGQGPLELQPPAPRQAPHPGAINKPQAPSEPAIVFDHGSMKDPDDWKVKYFDVVVVINKAVSGQNVYVYSKLDGGMPALVMNDIKVSTGREIAELSNEDRAAAGMRLLKQAPTSSYFSNTPTGYFTPTLFSINHVSRDWEGAAMDHAVFFHPRGIATHRAPPGSEAQLGQRASGACVRMTRSDARDLFWLIRQTGGPVTAGELAGRQFKRTSPGPSFANELKAQQAKGFTTYAETPSIPAFDRTGNIKYAVGEDQRALVDTEGQPVPVMRAALARTLIVVENRELARTATSRNRR